MDPIISNLKMESNKTGKGLWKYMIASKGLFPFHLQCCVLVKSFNISSIRHVGSVVTELEVIRGFYYLAQTSDATA